MGYMVHHAIVVTSWQKEAIDEAHDRAGEICGPLTSSIIEGVVNMQWSFFVAPDGSKEGWETSDEWDGNRAALIDRLDEMVARDRWVDYVEVQFGGDEPDANTRIVRAVQPYKEV